MQRYIKTMRGRVCGRGGGGDTTMYIQQCTYIVLKAHILYSINNHRDRMIALNQYKIYLTPFFQVARLSYSCNI